MKTLKNKLLTVTVLFTTALFGQSAMANTNSPGIDKKQDNQKQRIVNGVESGQLTGKEAWRLGNSKEEFIIKNNA